MARINKVLRIAVCFASVFVCLFLCFAFGSVFTAAPEPPAPLETDFTTTQEATEPETTEETLTEAETETETTETAEETSTEAETERVTEIIFEEVKQPPKYATSTDLREITFLAVGDTTLASESRKGYSGSFAQYYDLYGPGYFMENIAPIFKSGDCVVANLECVLTDNADPGIKRAGQYHYKGRTEFTSILTEGGVDVVNLSNNHTYDYSQTGYDDTVAALEAAGVGYFGNGTVLIREINGIKVGFVSSVGYGTSAIKAGLDYMEAGGVELKIVSFHWGNMDQRIANSSQVASARYAIDNGADLVLGHHPHVLQGIELYKGRYIAYSLGNFIFDGNVISDIENRTSVVLQVKFVLRGAEIAECGIELIPILTTSNFSRNNFRPMLAEGDQKKAILDKIAARSR